MAGTDARLPAVVIDCGTGYTKMGYAGNSSPNYIGEGSPLSASIFRYPSALRCPVVSCIPLSPSLALLCLYLAKLLLLSLSPRPLLLLLLRLLNRAASSGGLVPPSCLSVCVS